jgi:predicted acylesterase/phospholipase RssA
MATFNEVRAAELDELGKLRRRRGLELPAEEARVGLAFSGGGIRSATINLGILQGLAKYGLLKRVDYLSTVSGGGFIGGWLVRWINERGVHEVERRLGQVAVEPAPVTFLRDYSNYLTPRKGLLGADTWAAIATYLRNVLLNQTILIGFLGALLFVPWILGSFFDYGPVMEAKPLLIGALAAILVVFAVAAGVVNTTTCAGPPAKMEYGWTSQRCVLTRVVLPLFAGACCLNYTIWREPDAWTLRFCVLSGLAVYAMGHFAGWLASTAMFGRNSKGLPTFWNVFWALPSGALAGIEVYALKLLVAQWVADPLKGKWEAVSWGPPLFVLAFLLAGTLHIGLAKFELRNEIHEWWARLGGWLMLWGLFWAAFFGLAIFVPLMVFKVSAYESGPALWAKRAAILGWMVHSGLGARLGWSKSTSGSSHSQSLKEIVAKLAPFVFVAGLLVLIATPAHALALAVTRLPLDDEENWWALTAAVPSLTFLALAAGLGLLTAFFSWRVDINRFSMNLLYRNRLVRCYLGASNEHREAQKFTGFDPADDLRLACLAEADACDRGEVTMQPEAYNGPYPIMNATLNVTHGQRLGWQERKAESFIFTPKYCGFDYPEMKEAENRKSAAMKGADDGGYHDTDGWAMREHGISLGTAIAVSGAAVSPNMGFHTYAPLAFLMTIFNVRLGEWLANPRFANDKFLPSLSHALTRMETHQPNQVAGLANQAKSSLTSPEGAPRSSLLYLLFELFGTTTDVSKYVYLSDGAHFENLAIYELVRRECDFIIASDAGEDVGYVFADLANAIRKCRTDLGAEIVLNLAPVTANPQTSHAKSHAIRGEILYRSGKVGQILYFKSCLTGEEPNDVKDYCRLHPEFPQQSTADQWFDESQFESYRALGLLAANNILARAKSHTPSIDTVFAAAPVE